MCALRDKVECICQHPWAGTYVWTHRHQGPVPGGKLAASHREERQLVTKIQSEDQLCPSSPCTKSQTSLAKTATVTSQPQAGKSHIGSWQKKFSRSLALTSCCHGEKLHEQPHTKPLSVLPKGRLVSPRRTVRVPTSDVQIQTVFMDVPWYTL